MKKLFIWLLAIVLIAGACVGTYFLGKAVAHRPVVETTKGNTTYKVKYLTDSYVQGESLVFEIIATSDVKFNALKFSVDNGADEALSVKTGETKDLSKDDQVGSGKYFIRSEVKIIDTTDFDAGWYPVVVKATDAEGSVYVLTAKPILVQVTAPATTTNTDAAA